jgi:nucleotide-binding universal stress UspA family protein
MKILTGYVRTAEGRAALDRAAEEALLRDADLLVVRAVRAGDKDEAQETAEYRQELSNVEKGLRNRGVRVTVRELVRPGSAAESLVGFAEDEAVDLMVIGLRARSPVGKVVLGSDAQDILLGAGCPVLAVKAGD